MIRDTIARVAQARNVAKFERYADRQREAETFIVQLLARTPALREPGRLAIHERQVWSQNGEDGVIEEIFSRIGVDARTFVEFGCGNGVENNTAYLLHQGWQGLWIDADSKLVARIRRSHEFLLSSGALRMVESSVTAANVERLFDGADVPDSVDLMSIDIDGNDYWVWEAIERWKPRVVVIEYNAMWPPNVSWVQSYEPDRMWAGGSHHGASLAALGSLADRKGYKLVHCDLAGVNAFFVRSDLIDDYFPGPHTVDRMWQPARYFLSVPPARRREVGRFEIVS